MGAHKDYTNVEIISKLITTACSNTDKLRFIKEDCSTFIPHSSICIFKKKNYYLLCYLILNYESGLNAFSWFTSRTINLGNEWKRKHRSFDSLRQTNQKKSLNLNMSSLLNLSWVCVGAVAISSDSISRFFAFRVDLSLT